MQRNLKLGVFATACAALLAPSAHAGGWVGQAPQPTPTEDAASAEIDGLIYIAGGLSGPPGALQPQASLQAFDPTTGAWTALAPMPGIRYEGDGADVIDGQLYIAGGWTESPPIPNANLWVYDPPSNTWQTKASLPHLSGCGATGAIRGKLYVTTACNGLSGYTALLDVYDPPTDSWSSLPPSQEAHSQPAFGVINDKLYVAGGLGASGQLTRVTEMFDPLTSQWTELAPMPLALQAVASAVLDGKLYVFGGDGTSALQSVMAYDPVKNHWRILPQYLPSPLQGATAATDYGVLFVTGGADQYGNLYGTNQYLVVAPSIP